MALTAAEKQKIARILGSTPTIVAAHVTALGAAITSDLETDIRTELTRWTTAGANFVAIEPKDSNFGARIDPGAEQNDIRRNLASLLEWPYLSTATATMGSLQIG